VEQFESIRRDQREEGLSIRALARRHGVHRRAVRQALVSATPPSKSVPPRACPMLDPHKATIRRWLIEDLSAPAKQRHTARRIWERLVDEEDATLSEASVRRYVRTVRTGLGLERRPVTIVAVHLPGEEAQVDFGQADAIIAGVRTRISIFDLRLSHSAEAVHIAFPTEGAEAFLEGHVRAFGRIGGVPERIRYDNPRVMVTRILRGRDRELTDRFVALRSHYGFDSFFCEPGEEGAHEKGGVEGDIGRFRRRHLVPLPVVAGLAELNAYLAAADRADLARHVAGRLETVGEDALTDRAALRPLTGRALRFRADRACSRRLQGARLRSSELLLGARPLCRP
jgi:transposase